MRTPELNLRCLSIGGIASLALGACLQVQAQVLWSDNFASYNPGYLNANASGGPNQAPNGGPGNPWWGSGSGSFVVARSFNGITPYGGASQLVYGSAPNVFAVQYNNIGYRLNGGLNFQGNVTLSWAFYDPAGAGPNAAGYQDIAYLNGYQAADGYTATADYTGSGPLLQNSYTFGDEILGLGAYNHQGASPTVYQARVIGATVANHGATYLANGWFNLGVTRTVGWHVASIVLGAPNGANTSVSMFIDGIDVLDGTTGTTVGVNTIAMNGGVGSQLGAFDNFVLSVPEPASGALLLLGGVSLLGWRRRR